MKKDDDSTIWRVSFAGLIGTAIEWYDLFIFGTAAAGAVIEG